MTTKHLADILGCPINGFWEEDEGNPQWVETTYNGITVMVDADAERISVYQEGTGINLDLERADYGRVLELMTSGLIEQMLPLSIAWAKEPPQPVTPPFIVTLTAGSLAYWHTLSRDEQIRLRPLYRRLERLIIDADTEGRAEELFAMLTQKVDEVKQSKGESTQ